MKNDPSTWGNESRTSVTGTEEALRERVKELTCLYGLARLFGQPDLPVEELLRSIATLLPPACRYPELARARIVLDDRAHESDGFSPGVTGLRSPLVVRDRDRGFVEVVYLDSPGPPGENPFLDEERSLIELVGDRLSDLLARRQDREDKAALEKQLLHADRLATIGQLAAGVAHELNEPLGAILGFAQLAQAAPDVPAPVATDLAKIVRACLHAREVVRKLRLFARQLPPDRVPVSLNDVVRDNLYFFAARCGSQSVELVQELSPDLPPIVADAGQLNQVLLNLAVNALQAMPGGGRLTLRTSVEGDQVALAVEDTGIGMSEGVLEQVFVPFFTTKDADHGTGLGLAVVHGIVSAHGGTITVESRPGHGSRFTVRLPFVARSVGAGATEVRT